MSLRDLATKDLNTILTSDFGIEILLTPPAGIARTVTGYTNDIAQAIDPDTGQIISGRVISIAIALRTLSEQGLEIPRGYADESVNPWLVQFLDTDLKAYQFKILASNPDRALGIVTCELEFFKNL
jgi:hypothetical protein